LQGPLSGYLVSRERERPEEENPKSEYRNPKQIQITKKENPKQEHRPVLDLGG
jgi:hypothetical protein